MTVKLRFVCKIPLLAHALGLKAESARDDRVYCIQSYDRPIDSSLIQLISIRSTPSANILLLGSLNLDRSARIPSLVSLCLDPSAWII